VEGVLDAARAAGERLAASAAGGPAGPESLMTLLAVNGYEPAPDADGVIRLRNCPFHALAKRHRPLTCSMNLALLRSVATAIPATGLIAEPHPADGFCCVAFIQAASSPGI
jgi:predicted ArsR family transcriptional regulator